MSTSAHVLDFKSATLYAVRLVLHSADTDALLAALEQRMSDMGSFFDDEPVVIDALRLTTPPDWTALAKALAAHRLPLIGVAAPSAQHDSVRAAGLTPVSLASGGGNRAPATDTLTAASPAADAPVPDTPALEAVAQVGVAQTHPAPASQEAADPAAPAAETHASEQDAHADVTPQATLILDRSLRSGQKVYARGADLIVIGQVSPGAEVIADGSIHVYGPLRGKAMAGARGDTSARIFTTQLDAELVAVAGVYRVVDTRLPADVLNRPATVRLAGDALQVEPLPI